MFATKLSAVGCQKAGEARQPFVCITGSVRFYADYSISVTCDTEDGIGWFLGYYDASSRKNWRGDYVGQRHLLRETLTKRLESVGASRETLQVLKWGDFVAIADLVISEGANVEDAMELITLVNVYDLSGKPIGLCKPTPKVANYQTMPDNQPACLPMTLPAGAGKTK
jgi:hypothetical protein